MPKPEDSLSALFQSLGLDDTKFQATTNAAAQEAERRWPLFKAVSSKRPESTPALSAQERPTWSSQDKSEVGACKPPLSMPDLSREQDTSLSKISEPPLAGAAASTAPIAQESLLSAPPGSDQDFSQEEATAKTHSSLFAAPAVVQNVEVGGSGLFEKIVAELATAEPDLSAAGHADEPLVSVFSRLQGKGRVVSKPAERLSSFLGRLGK